MTAQLQLRNNQNDDLVLQDIENTQRLCASLMKTPHYAKMGEVGIFAIVQKARSVGMSPLDALNGGMYFVQGKVEMQGQSMLALIRQHGHSVSMDPKSTDTCVRMFGRRADNGDTWTAQFSVEDAKKQGIYRNQWEKMPKVMCMWRCVSQLGRFLFSDILKGVYVQGEISEAPAFNAPVNLDFSTGELIEDKPTVSASQALELEEIILQCSKDYQDKVEKYLKKLSISSVGELPVEAFESLKNKATQMREEHRSNLIVESNKMVKENLFEVEVV
jgi:hypothetical protein